MPFDQNKRALTSFELEELVLNLDLDQSDIGDLSSESGDEVDVDFYLYEGKGSSVESSLFKTPEKLDVGSRMVLELTETLPIGVSVYTDRHFTSISLIDVLLSRQITLAGTIMASRIPKNAIPQTDN
ncbi:uncharacterized protein LOC126743340 [Anthonomus grandis grandis]|uniref:uncharacterized protein LOC126743340 n=1 Tax=Anthonomus grandis grandis TaxID=2921223 RepID=UPI002165F1DD|nr:uncharacterized protein LOC126743340 [Anthonomus grandis grandis]